jgi:hypothetical protein
MEETIEPVFSSHEALKTAYRISQDFKPMVRHKQPVYAKRKNYGKPVPMVFTGSSNSRISAYYKDAA